MNWISVICVLLTAYEIYAIGMRAWKHSNRKWVRPRCWQLLYFSGEDDWFLKRNIFKKSSSRNSSSWRLFLSHQIKLVLEDWVRRWYGVNMFSPTSNPSHCFKGLYGYDCTFFRYQRRSYLSEQPSQYFLIESISRFRPRNKVYQLQTCLNCF